jgi:dCTP deaminase
MVYSDRAIIKAIYEERLSIEPYLLGNLQPASYDLTLDSLFRMPSIKVQRIDLANVQPDHTGLFEVGEEGFVMEPGEFIIGCTREHVKLNPTLVARVEGKSSLGRLGLTIHVTAGFIDPGFSGQITLEMFNAAPWEIVIYPGMKVAQLAIQAVEGEVINPYGSAGNHYQDQRGPTESKYKLVRPT